MPARIHIKKRSKYGNRKTVVDGIEFDSAKEAKRYGELKLLERNGDIRALKIQPPFQLSVGAVLVCTYRADFAYLEVATNAYIVEDAKGFRTRVYQIKKKLMLALHGIDIREV